MLVPLVALPALPLGLAGRDHRRSFGSAPSIPNKQSVIPTTAAGQLQAALKELGRRSK